MSSTTTESAVEQREQWGSQVGFLLAAIGSAIGLGNIWRFPGVAYENGGGAFILPYMVALLTAGIPVLFLDYSLGHRFRGSAPAVFRRLSKKFEWLGWWQVLISFVIMTYYAVIVAWGLRYTVFSFNLAWGEDAGSFFYEYIGLGAISDAGVPEYSAAPVHGVIIPLILVWAFSLITIGLGVTKGVERANKFFLPLLVIMFAGIVIRAMTLPGAGDGLNALFTPNWSALADYRVWIAAYGQIFYSLSIAFGIMLTYSSYLKKRSNLVGTGLVAAFANSSFEILAGLGVFATLGFMANTQGVAVGDLEGISGVALSFVTFPTVISEMPGGPIFGVVFFASFTMAGLTSMISIIQVVAAAFGEKFNLTPRKAALITGIPAALISFVLFGTSSGLYDLDVVDAYINNIGVASSAIIMCLGIAWVLRRSKVLQRHLNVVSETKLVGTWWRAAIAVVVPALLGYMFINAFWAYATEGYGYAKSFEGVFGWGMLALCVLATAVLSLVKWRTPVDDFTPLDLELHEGENA